MFIELAITIGMDFIDVLTQANHSQSEYKIEGHIVLKKIKS